MSDLIIIYFYIKPHRISRNGACPVYCRVTQNCDRREFSLKCGVNPALWDQKRQRAKGNSETSRTLNYFLDNFQSKITRHFTELSADNRATLDNLISRINDKPANDTLLTVFDEILSQKKKLVNIEITQARINRYQVARRKLISFLEESFSKKDIGLNEINNDFIGKFETYLISTSCIRNTANTYLKILKTCGSTAFHNGLLDRNPFQNHKCRYNKTRRGYLTADEIKAIMNVELSDSYLALTRDVFLFCVFTGLAYVDVYNLTKSNVEIGADGDERLIVYRSKTNERSVIPLLGVAKNIMKRYENHPKCIERGTVLPVPPNQKMNLYLKIIASKAGIDKRLSTHLARHTFATTVALMNGMSLETVGHVLGHSNPRTTKIYAAMTAERVDREMNSLQDKISEAYQYN